MPSCLAAKQHRSVDTELSTPPTAPTLRRYVAKRLRCEAALRRGEFSECRLGKPDRSWFAAGGEERFARGYSRPSKRFRYLELSAPVALSEVTFTIGRRKEAALRTYKLPGGRWSGSRSKPRGRQGSRLFREFRPFFCCLAGWCVRLCGWFPNPRSKSLQCRGEVPSRRCNRRLRCCTVAASFHRP